MKLQKPLLFLPICLFSTLLFLHACNTDCNLIYAEYRFSGAVSYDSHLGGPIEIRVCPRSGVFCGNSLFIVGTDLKCTGKTTLESPGSFNIQAAVNGTPDVDIVAFCDENLNGRCDGNDAGGILTVPAGDHDGLELTLAAGFCPDGHFDE